MDKLDLAINIMKHLNERKSITITSIKDEFNVSRSTAYRYIQKLSTVFPIVQNQDKTYALMDHYKIKDGLFLDHEIAFLEAVMDYSKTILNGGSKSRLESIKKGLVLNALNQDTTAIISGESIDFDLISDNYFVLQSFIKNSEICKFKFRNYDNDYLIKPLKIIYYSGLWYLLSMRGDEFRTFTLIDIHDIRATDEYFDKSNEYINDYLQNAKTIWYSNKDQQEKVVINISDSVAKYFRRLHYLPNQKIEKEYDDGSIDISFTISSEIEFSHLLLGWFSYFKVVEPAKYKNYIDRLIEEYGEKK